MMLGLSIVKLSLCLEIHFTESAVPMHVSISYWHCANARLYIIVALCQSIPLYPNGTVPMYTYILVALCQCIRLFSCGTVPMYTYTSIFLWNCANVHLYVYFLVAQRQCLPLRVFSSGTGSLHALNVCIF